MTGEVDGQPVCNCATELPPVHAAEDEEPLRTRAEPGGHDASPLS